MSVGRAVCAMLLAGAGLLLAVPAMADSIQSQGTLPHGGSYVIYRDTGIDATAIDIWFRAPSDGYDATLPGISRVAATAAAASKLASGKSLAETVRGFGGDIAIQAYPDIVGVSVVVPASAARRVLASMTAAYFAPAIDDAAVKTAQQDAAVLAVEQRYSVDQVLHDALFAQLFAGGPAHVSPLPDSVDAFARIDAAEISSFASRAFRSANATLTIVGDIDPASLDAVTAGSPNGGEAAPIDSPLAASPAPLSRIPSVDSGLGLAWVGPAIVDEKAATAMDFIADYLFRDTTGLVSKAVDASEDTYISSGQFVTLHDPGIMLVTVAGTHTAAAKTQILDAISRLSQPLDAATFDAARAAFLYHLAVDTQLPSGEADNLGWYAAEGNPSYAPGYLGGTYLQNARSLDPAYVASVVKKYLVQPFTVQLLPAATKESSS